MKRSFLVSGVNRRVRPIVRQANGSLCFAGFKLCWRLQLTSLLILACLIPAAEGEQQLREAQSAAVAAGAADLYASNWTGHMGSSRSTRPESPVGQLVRDDAGCSANVPGIPVCC
jgi:hypothetical protein